MKNIKLLIFDLDDTLLDSSKLIGRRTRDAIQKASAIGILIGYISARSPRSVPKILNGLPVDAVSYYGGVKTYCGSKLIDSRPIPNDAGSRLLNGFKRKKPNGYINIYFEPYSLRYNSLYKSWKPCDESVGNAIEGLDIQRIIIRTSDIRLIDEFITGEMKMVPTRHGDTIIVHEAADKGSAAGAVMSHYGIKAENAVAFGDDASDFPMLRACGTGVAMGNAIYEVKSVADYITDSHDDGGVAKWIEKHILKQE